ncbi:MAG: Ppx/GppA phosphatase family protein [Planctomycetota bacterium]|jgi:exopolyphosphatase/guanosine-5'-triphosphate,3'-diphosphate pyrophosphatase
MGKSSIPSGARLAAIDIGTNSVLLTVAGRGPGGRLSPVHNSARICRLGEGIGSGGGSLLETAAKRTLECLRELRIEAQAHGASQIIAAGTEVLRAVDNADTFAEAAEEVLGTPITILSGEREAQLAWLGVTGGRYPSRPTALLDVGGGSTEYVRATTRGMLPPVSIPIGTIRLLETLDEDGPAGLSGLAAAAMVEAGLQPQKNDKLVIVGGTATTLAAVLKGYDSHDLKKIEGTRIGMADMLGLLNRLWSVERDERLKIPGMDPERVDTIVPGAVVLAVGMKVLDAREATVSTRGLRHGILIDAFGMGKK